MSFKIDHRLLADEMELYFFDESIGAGLPVWLPNGVSIRDELENFMKKLEDRAGFQRVVSPHIAKEDLYLKSRHLKAFSQNMFPPLSWPEENSKYYLKPMNCPHHHLVFSSRLRSYRHLPLRIAEFGQVYRYENSGSLRGLSRVRALCQNDAHIYVDPNQSLEEVERVLKMHEFVYSYLKVSGYRYRLSKHDPQRPSDFEGPQELWIQCEQILRQALINLNLPFFEAEGEAAFYGPKIDVQVKMFGNIEESIASVQLDFNSGPKFDLGFIDSNGLRKIPWVIHRAPMGSHERFVAYLIEFFEGQLPAWLSPVQVYVIPVQESHRSPSLKISEALRREGLRVQVDQREGSLSKRIAFAHQLRPFSKIIVGEKEAESGKFVFQFRDGGRQEGQAEELAGLFKRKMGEMPQCY